MELVIDMAWVGFCVMEKTFSCVVTVLHAEGCSKPLRVAELFINVHIGIFIT